MQVFAIFVMTSVQKMNIKMKEKKKTAKHKSVVFISRMYLIFQRLK